MSELVKRQTGAMVASGQFADYVPVVAGAFAFGKVKMSMLFATALSLAIPTTDDLDKKPTLAVLFAMQMLDDWKDLSQNAKDEFDKLGVSSLTSHKGPNKIAPFINPIDEPDVAAAWLSLAALVIHQKAYDDDTQKRGIDGALADTRFSDVAATAATAENAQHEAESGKSSTAKEQAAGHFSTIRKKQKLDVAEEKPCQCQGSKPCGYWGALCCRRCC